MTDSFWNLRVNPEKIFVVIALFLASGGVLGLLLGLHEAGRDTAGGVLLLQVIWLVMYLSTAALILRRRYALSLRLLLADKLLVALIVLAVLSVAWAVEPEVAARRALALIGSSLLGLYLAMRFTPAQWLRLLAYTLLLASLLSMLFSLLLPQYGIASDIHEGAWQGAFVHKNLLGRFMTLAGLLFILMAIDAKSLKRRGWLLAFALVFWILVMSQSRTALVTLAVLVIAIPVVTMMRRLGVQVKIIICSASAVLLLGLSWVAADLVPTLEGFGIDTTLTGRVPLWMVALDRVGDRPWLGFGYGSVWLGPESIGGGIWRAVRWEPAHAHNGFIDITLELGLVGLILFLLHFSRLIFFALNTSHDPRNPAIDFWPILFLLFTLVTNTTESFILRQNNFFWVVYVATAYSLMLGQAQFRSVPQNRASLPTRRPGFQLTPGNAL